MPNQKGYRAIDHRNHEYINMAHCVSKLGFKSPGQAHQYIEDNQDNWVNGNTLFVYQCPICHLYHTTKKAHGDQPRV